MEDELRRTIGLSIAVARRRRGLSQRELALTVKVQPGQISDWERGRFLPTVDALVRIARKLEVSLDYLVTGEQGLEERFAAIQARYDEKLKDLDRRIEQALESKA